MKNECSIVKDLLPLYVENLVSDETRAFVEAHFAECDDCRKAFDGDRTAVEKAPDESALPLKNVKENLKQQNHKRILIAVLIAMIVLITGFGYLTTPQYVPYSEELLSISEKADGSIVVSFDNEKVTSFVVDDFGFNENGDEVVIYIHAWKTIWNNLFFGGGIQDVILDQEEGQPIRAIFYSPSNNKEAIQIWGEDVGYWTVLLPRLALGYYLIAAVIASVLGGVLLFFFRKNEKIRIWIERITLIPAAYVIGHVITKGFSTITYSIGRDFVFILIVTVLLYAAIQIGLNLYRHMKNEVKL